MAAIRLIDRIRLTTYTCAECGWTGEVIHKVGVKTRKCPDCAAKYAREWRAKQPKRPKTEKEIVAEERRKLLRSDLQFSPEDADLNDLLWTFDKDGYAIRSIGHKIIKAHQIVVQRKFGYSPKLGSGLVIDHENRNRRDNRRDNLRLVTYKINRENSLQTILKKGLTLDTISPKICGDER